MMNEPMVVLESSEGRRVVMPVEAATQSLLVKEVIAENDVVTENQILIPTHNLNWDTLMLIETFCRHEVDDPMPMAQPPAQGTFLLNDLVPQWHVEFIEALTREQACQVVQAADYLIIPSLIHLGCLKLVAEIRSLTIDQLDLALGTDELELNQSHIEVMQAFNSWGATE